MKTETTKQDPASVLNMAVVPQSFLDGLLEEVKEVKNILRQKSDAELGAQWLTSEEARIMLGVSRKTWQTYRNEKRIPFSQFGRKITVLRADIETFMRANYIKARN